MTATPSRVLTRQGADRRDELLAHAERLFTEQGYAETRMIDLARAAGVAKGLVYWYFESKEALLHAVAVDLRDRLRVDQALVIGDIDNSLARIHAGVEASARFVTEHWRLYAVLQALNSTTGDPLADSARDHATDAIVEIERGQDAGLIRRDDSPIALAYAIQGIINQLVTAHLRGHIESLEETTETAARCAVHILATSTDEAERAVELSRARHR